jgi:hypothetical protein
MHTVEEFVQGVESIGFKLKKKVVLIDEDATNKMFVMLDFVVDTPKEGTVPLLNPCIYKRR